MLAASQAGAGETAVFRRVLFQIHWFAGITVGTVLALVGLTGALLALEHPVLEALNRSERTLAASGDPALAPNALLAQVREQVGERRIVSLQISSDPEDAARVTLASLEKAAPDAPPNRRPRPETRYLDPRTGQIFSSPGNRGEGFFRAVTQLHRWLILGDLGSQAIGRQIVGASTALCIFLALSGLYLRWPRRNRLDWRTWLKVDFSRRGRPFLWRLHAISGTWVLPFYLLISLTGLQWSYEWYRKGLYAVAGVEMPARRPPGGEGGATPPAVDLAPAFEALRSVTATSGFSSATFVLPQSAADPLEIRYLDLDPPHERALNTLAVDSSGAVVRAERYAEKSAGGKLVASILMLHTGSFFGPLGSIAFALASLTMPLFAVTGWMLYLDRRRARRRMSARVALEGVSTSS
jgi:sulfite reductase (NADPH) flavoprotein alpha-component